MKTNKHWKNVCCYLVGFRFIFIQFVSSSIILQCNNGKLITCQHLFFSFILFCFHCIIIIIILFSFFFIQGFLLFIFSTSKSSSHSNVVYFSTWFCRFLLYEKCANHVKKKAKKKGKKTQPCIKEHIQWVKLFRTNVTSNNIINAKKLNGW